jgi:hypothetical protein
LTANIAPEPLDPSVDPLVVSPLNAELGMVDGLGPEQQMNPDLARQAVLDAVNSVTPEQANQPLSPLQNIGAQILDEIPHPQTQEASVPPEKMAPPIVPPPLPLPNQQV